MNRFFYIVSLLFVFMAVAAMASEPVKSDSLVMALSSEQAVLQDQKAQQQSDPESSSGESFGSLLLTPVTVTSGGKMNLASGQSIVLKPGTRVLSGGYFRATILAESKDHKTAIRQYRKSKRMLGVEKDIEPTILAETQNTISPFAKKSTGRSIGEGDDNEESLNALVSDISGISPEQNRKPAGYTITRITFNSARIAQSGQYRFIASSEKRETTAVLRL